MERLDAPVHHLGKAGVLGNLAHGNAGFAQRFERAAGREQLDRELGQLAREGLESGLVGDAEESALDLGEGHGVVRAAAREPVMLAPVRALRARRERARTHFFGGSFWAFFFSSFFGPLLAGTLPSSASSSPK